MFVFVELSFETFGSDGSGFRILLLCIVRIDVSPCKASGSDGSGFRILLLGNARIEVSPRKSSGSDGSRFRILFPYSDARKSEPEVLSAMVQMVRLVLTSSRMAVSLAYRELFLGGPKLGRALHCALPNPCASRKRYH